MATKARTNRRWKVIMVVGKWFSESFGNRGRVSSDADYIMYKQHLLKQKKEIIWIIYPFTNRTYA